MDSIIIIIAVDGEERTRVVAPFRGGNFGHRAAQARQEFLRIHPDITESRIAMRYERYDGEVDTDRT